MTTSQQIAKLADAWLALREGKRTLTPELQQQLEAIGIHTAEIVAAVAEAPPVPAKIRKGGWKNSGVPYFRTATGKRETAANKAEANRCAADILRRRGEDGRDIEFGAQEFAKWTPQVRANMKAAHLLIYERFKSDYELFRSKEVAKNEKDGNGSGAVRNGRSFQTEQRKELQSRNAEMRRQFDAIRRDEANREEIRQWWISAFGDDEAQATIREWVTHPPIVVQLVDAVLCSKHTTSERLPQPDKEQGDELATLLERIEERIWLSGLYMVFRSLHVLTKEYKNLDAPSLLDNDLRSTAQRERRKRDYMSGIIELVGWCPELVGEYGFSDLRRLIDKHIASLPELPPTDEDVESIREITRAEERSSYQSRSDMHDPRQTEE